MPTVSNHDVLGSLAWGAGGNARHFNRDSFGSDRSDARGGINSLLFGENGHHHHNGGNASPAAPSASPLACAANLSSLVPQEHAYASPQRGGSNFVSVNGYYGYHQQHAAVAPAPAAAPAAEAADCSMDTSENNLSGHAFGVQPGGFAGPLPLATVPQNAWHADPINRIQRKRTQTQAAGRGFSCGQEGMDVSDHDMVEERAAKRFRTSPHRLDEHQPGASTQAMAQGFGVLNSTPSIAELSHSPAPAQMYDLPTQQLPGSTSQLVDAMTPRPRYVSGRDAKIENLSGRKMERRILEDSELAAFESLLKHTHGCDYYNYDGCEL